MAKVRITIDGREIICEEGETIVDIARKNSIFIPTICYLGGCSPTLACKMCMAETSDGKRIYTCNTKAKEGLTISTQTEQLQKERQMIMQTYDVNHPLECGVCDKSGECELQNLTLYTKVAHQDYALSDDEKHEKSWAQALYDPNLCIVCERCVTTCKDNIGEAKLKSGKADLHTPDNYKDSMLKDPYSVWSKKQKSLIEFVGDTPCVDCGECIAVCPVGALTYKDFSYSANAWELKKIDSTCHYCSMGCHITYETRHHNTIGEKKIYRVSNDFHFAPICGAGRFGFSVASRGLLESRVDAKETKPYFTHLHKASALRLGSSITNEEAMIASIVSVHFGIKLYNESARAYQRFLPYLRLDHTLQDLKDSSTIIALGAPIRLQAPLLQYAINNTIRTKKGVRFYYFHPIADALLTSFSRSVVHIPYTPGADEIALGALLVSIQNKLEEAIAQSDRAKDVQTMLSTLLSTIIASKQPTIKVESGVDSSLESTQAESSPHEPPTYSILQEAKIDSSALRDLSNVDLTQMSVVIGEEAMLCALQDNSGIIAGLQILEHCGVRVFIVPSGSNTAGIARVCGELLEIDSALDTTTESNADGASEEFVIGVRADGDVVWDCAWSDGDKILAKEPAVVLPSHQQMLGSVTNFENRLLPFAQAKDYHGDDLATILYEYNQARLATSSDNGVGGLLERAQNGTNGLLDYFSTYTELCDYTKALPQSKGYSAKELASIANYYTQGGEDRRGYMLAPLLSGDLATAYAIGTKSPTIFNAFITYPQNLFSIQTILDSNMQQKDGFYTSGAYLEKLGLAEGDIITLHKPHARCGSITGAVYIDYAISEDVWLISPNIAKEWGANTYVYVECAKVAKE